MSRKLARPAAAVLALITCPVAGAEKGKASMLAAAVKEFNRRAQKDPTVTAPGVGAPGPL